MLTDHDVWKEVWTHSHQMSRHRQQKHRWSTNWRLHDQTKTRRVAACSRAAWTWNKQHVYPSAQVLRGLVQSSNSPELKHVRDESITPSAFGSSTSPPSSLLSLVLTSWFSTDMFIITTSTSGWKDVVWDAETERCERGWCHTMIQLWYLNVCL